MNEDIIVSKSRYDDFSSRSPTRNLEIIVEGQSFFVNAGWLAELSPFFTNYCFHEENNSLIIDDIKSSEMLEFFRCICFCPTRKVLTVSNVSLVIKVATRFEMRPVIARCEQFIERTASTLDRDRLFQVTCAVSNCDPNSSTMSVLVDRLAEEELAGMEFSKMPGDIVAEVYNQKFRKGKRQKWCCLIGWLSGFYRIISRNN